MGIIYLNKTYNEQEAVFVTGLNRRLVSYFATNGSIVAQDSRNRLFFSGRSLVDFVCKYSTNLRFDSKRVIDLTRWVASKNQEILEITGNNFPVKCSTAGFYSITQFIEKYKTIPGQTISSAKNTLEKLADEIIYGVHDSVPYAQGKNTTVYEESSFDNFVTSKNVFLCQKKRWNRFRISEYLTDECGKKVDVRRVKILIELASSKNKSLPVEEQMPIIIESDREGETIYEPTEKFLDALVKEAKEYIPKRAPIIISIKSLEFIKKYKSKINGMNGSST